MKAITEQLLAFLQGASVLYRVDLLEIDLPNGEKILAVIGPWDVAWNGNTYLAANYGVWERGEVTSVADFSLESQSLSLKLTADTDILVPGTSTPIMNVITSGFFDGCAVTLTTAYMPLSNYGSITGTLALFSGVIVNPQRVGRSKAEFDVRDWMYILNQKIPLRVIQPSCSQTLFDAGCALSAASYAITNTVAAGSTQVTIVPVADWPTTDPNGRNPQSASPPYFNQGKIVFTSGQNKGLSGHVAAQGSGALGSLTLAQAMPFPVTEGDAFTAYPGCAKTFAACEAFGNQLHFSGFLFTPPPETSF